MHINYGNTTNMNLWNNSTSVCWCWAGAPAARTRPGTAFAGHGSSRHPHCPNFKLPVTRTRTRKLTRKPRSRFCKARLGPGVCVPSALCRCRSSKFLPSLVCGRCPTRSDPPTGTPGDPGCRGPVTVGQSAAPSESASNGLTRWRAGRSDWIP